MSYPMTTREAIAQATMSDDALADERKAQDILYAALSEFRSKCQDAWCLTSLMDEQIREMLRSMNDEVPCREIWNERIMEERRG